jgi:hypothetical protein
MVRKDFDLCDTCFDYLDAMFGTAGERKPPVQVNRYDK